jgi:ribokinase
MAGICVVGSLNMDLVAVAEHFPKPGETIIGKEFGTYPGGKGANQAVAAGRLYASVRMVGKVGNDAFGEQQIRNLKQNGVGTRGVRVEKEISSGIALIEVDNGGENNIVVIPGANGKVNPEYIDNQFVSLLDSDIFLFQLEIPLETVFYAIRKLKERGKSIILDPAPAVALPEDIYPYIDFITPNETEISILTGTKPENEGLLHRAAEVLLAKGVKTIILKMGKNGAYIINNEQSVHVPGFRVKAIDTTAAGDTFNAAFAVSLAQGLALQESVIFANAAAALSTTAKGAQAAMPDMKKVRSFMRRS